MFTPDLFHLDLRTTSAPKNYIWACSGYGTTAPARGTVTGVAGFFSPPYAAPRTTLALTLLADQHPIPDQASLGKGDVGLLFSGHHWYPDHIQRSGSYHHRTPNGLTSLAVESSLLSLVQRPGFLQHLRITNRSPRPIHLELRWTLSPGDPAIVPLEKWDFTPPHPEGLESVATHLFQDSATPTTLAPQETIESRVAVLFTPASVSPPPSPDLASWHAESLAAWHATLDLASQNLPSIHSSIPGLERYCLTSLMSGLVCLWNHPDFATQPFLATSGIDGGSLCSYPWDVAGYGAPFWTLLLGPKANDILRSMLACGLDSHVAMSLTGSGVGWCSYAYSIFSVVRLAWTLYLYGHFDFSLLPELLRIFFADEARLPEQLHLKDYGEQHNLLEMRSCGYEHFVPSPNAERAWCYDRLADLASAAHLPHDTSAWHAKASAIRASIQTTLWDPARGWFRAIHPSHDEYVYSIQAFDALRFDATTPDIQHALLQHLQDGRFLSRYGISSVSAEDSLHYELNDPDWSGAGAYSGEGPELAETLWQHHEPTLAWDVLKRHFWLGESLPYFPQEHACDRPSMPPHKRANIVAGVTGYEAVLFGMAGLQPLPNGSLLIHPNPAPEGSVSIHNFRHRGRTIDLTFSPGFMSLSIQGTPTYSGPIQPITL